MGDTPRGAAGQAADLAEAEVLLADLRRRFRDGLGTRLRSLRLQLQQLEQGVAPTPDLQALHREVHGITGAAGTFGLPEVSRSARELETLLAALLHDPAPLGAAHLQAIERARRALERAAAQAPLAAAAALPSPAAVSDPGAVTPVYVYQPAGPDGGDWPQALAAAGYRLQVVDDLATLGPAHQAQAAATGSGSAAPVSQTQAPVLLLDLAQPEAVSPALTQVRRLVPASSTASWRVIAALPGDDLPLRLSASRAGVQRSLERPLQGERLIELLDTLTGRRPVQAFRVLLVDDDPLLLQAQAAVLRGAGMQVQALANPLQTLDVLQAFEPDVLLLDVYMPEVSGPELAAALREREAWLDLPVLFLSAETDLTQQLLALNLGGDDFLVKPVQPAHLVAAVTARARRARQNVALRRRLQTSLYEREREHLALDQHAIVSVADAHGCILYANDLFCRISGYTRDQAIGLHHRTLRAQGQPSSQFRAVLKAVRDGQVWQGELCCQRRDGSSYWTETTVTPFLDERGLLYQYVVIQTDISHIKCAEAALRRQRDLQRMVSLAAAALLAAAPSRVKDAIDPALQDSGMQLGADRAYLFTFSRDGSRMNGTRVWCAPGVSALPAAVQHSALNRIPWLAERFMNNEMLQIPDVAELPEDAATDRELLHSSGIRSLIVLPLQREGQPFGFLAYSMQRQRRDWSAEEVELLKVLRDVMASALARAWADTALRQSESRLNFLVSSSPVTIYACGTQPPFELVYVSPNVEPFLGCAPEAFTANPGFIASRVHPDDLWRVAEQRPQVLAQGELLQEYRLGTQHGEYRWVQDRCRLVRGSAGEPLEIIGYWMDITERKRIEAELAGFNQALEQRVTEQTRHVLESEQLAQATLDALGARVVILDAQGDIMAANRAWRDFGGGRAPEQVGNYPAYCDNGGVSHDPAAHPSLSTLATGMRSVMAGTARNFVLEHSLTLNGQTHWFVSRVERFGSVEVPRIVVSHEDITPMKLAERAQLRSQRLESLGTLSGGVAHDLNNALAPVLMGMTLLKEQYPQESKLFDMIQTSAQRGADMVRQLLTFARGVEGERVPVAAQPLLRELERLMKGSFPKNITLRVDLEPDLPSVLGDATQLHQVLLNLCVNARDAMPAGGALALHAQGVVFDDAYARSIPDARPGRYVALRVSDTGCGIAPDILDRIFDPFFTTKSADKGTGLGLSTVLGIVRAHGGFIQVYSQPGEGSQFTVYLPTAADADQGKAGQAVEAASRFQGHGETVLFVDDEAAVREVGRTVLQRLNLHPVLATDGVDALVQATTHRQALRAVITDLHMPHMDGLAFVRALRRSRPDLPVILASGRVDESVAAAFQTLGVTHRLDKPFTQEQLARCLHAVLGG